MLSYNFLEADWSRITEVEDMSLSGLTSVACFDLHLIDPWFSLFTSFVREMICTLTSQFDHLLNRRILLGDPESTMYPMFIRGRKSARNYKKMSVKIL